MSDKEKPTRAEVNRQETNPNTDRRNLASNQVTLPETEPSDVDSQIVSELEEHPEGTDRPSDPPEGDMARTHDDQDPFGDGVYDTPITKRYEDMADRDELARRIEELVADAYDWMKRSDEDDAHYVYETLVDLSERMGAAPEDTVATQPGPVPGDRDEADA